MKVDGLEPAEDRKLSMTELEVAVARDQIRNLVATYNNCGDRGRIDEFVEVFAPDGVLEISQQKLEGREAIHKELSGIASGARSDVDLSGSRHQLTTTRIEIIDATNAQGWIYFFVSRRGTIIQEGTYIDRYVKTPAGWRIAHRRVKMLFVAEIKD
jgi:hypothetical protein